MNPQGESKAGDRAALLRRIAWEQTTFRVVRAAVAVFLITGGVVSLAGTDSRSGGLFPVAVGLLMLWEARRGRSGENVPPNPLTSAQKEVLESTLARHGRLAAVRQLREWTGATYRDATRDIDAAFPEHAAARSN